MSFCRSSVAGLGHYLPEHALSNGELAGIVGCPAGELEKSGRIASRRFAAEGVGPSDLALEAAKLALQEAGQGAEAVEFIVFATMSPDFAFPGGGCLLQDKLGCRTIGALDVRAQCTGFLQALLIADQFIASGTYKNVLVVGSEVMSSYLEPKQPCIEAAECFGDAAGAMLLAGRQEGPSVPLTVVLHTDASGFESFWCEFPASRNFPLRVTPENIRAKQHLPRLRPELLLEEALAKLPEAIKAAVAASGASTKRIDRLLVQVLDPGAAEEIGRLAGFAGEQIVAVGEGTGTIGAAALPVALDAQRQAGGLKDRGCVCLASFGAGLNWGAAVLEL